MPSWLEYSRTHTKAPKAPKALVPGDYTLKFTGEWVQQLAQLGEEYVEALYHYARWATSEREDWKNSLLNDWMSAGERSWWPRKRESWHLMQQLRNHPHYGPRWLNEVVTYSLEFRKGLRGVSHLKRKG